MIDIFMELWIELHDVHVYFYSVYTVLVLSLIQIYSSSFKQNEKKNYE